MYKYNLTSHFEDGRNFTLYYFGGASPVFEKAGIGGAIIFPCTIGWLLPGLST